MIDLILFYDFIPEYIEYRQWVAFYFVVFLLIVVVCLHFPCILNTTLARESRTKQAVYFIWKCNSVSLLGILCLRVVYTGQSWCTSMLVWIYTHLYRVSLNGLIIFQGVIEGPQTNKKLYGRGGSKMQSWGDMGKILVFGLILQKKSWKIRVAF